MEQSAVVILWPDRTKSVVVTDGPKTVEQLRGIAAERGCAARAAVAAILLAGVAGCGGGNDTDNGAATIAGATTTDDTPPERVLTVGEERDFPPGQIEEGAMIVCENGGLRAEATVPPPRERGLVTNVGTAFDKSATLTLEVSIWSDRRVVTKCG